MEAGSILRRATFSLTLIALFVAWPGTATAGNRRTQNFIVHAPDARLADAVAEAAEKFRHDLAVYWLGEPLPPWPTPCPIRVISGPRLAAQGVTTYNPRPVRDFQMEVVGTPERILDSVLPHEVTHTILATYFGRPLPRWADEGICTTVEHSSERNKHELKLREFLNSRRGIAMNQLFLMTEYPSDVLPMYAQGYSVCRFLIDQKGPRAFIAFLHDYMQHPSWTDNVKKHYEYDSLKELQESWLAWVSEGSRSVEKFAKANTVQPRAPENGLNPDSRLQLVAGAIPGTEAVPNTGVIPAPSPDPIMLADARGMNLQPVSAGSVQATQLAARESDGWYLRKKLEAQNGEGAPRPSELPRSVPPASPPSVRQSGAYQTAHPQPMQGTGISSGAGISSGVGISPGPATWHAGMLR